MRNEVLATLEQKHGSMMRLLFYAACVVFQSSFFIAEAAAQDEPEYRIDKRNISLLSIAGVWMLAAILSVSVKVSGTTFVLPVIAAIPITALLLVIFNSLWGRRSWQFWTVSLLVWSILFLICWLLRSYNAWLLMILGVPATLIVWLSCRVKVKTK